MGKQLQKPAEYATESIDAWVSCSILAHVLGLCTAVEDYPKALKSEFGEVRPWRMKSSKNDQGICDDPPM
jgi:hypothetical protein